MRAIGRAAAVTAMAVALLGAGAAVFVRGPGVAVDPAVLLEVLEARRARR